MMAAVVADSNFVANRAGGRLKSRPADQAADGPREGSNPPAIASTTSAFFLLPVDRGRSGRTKKEGVS
jgi:hypothetical protein